MDWKFKPLALGQNQTGVDTMAKNPNPTPAPKQTPVPPPTTPEDNGITIVAKASRSDGGAIDVLRKHLVSNPDASLDNLKTMLTASGLSLADGTLRTTRTQTLAILMFIKAKQDGEKTTSIEGHTDAIKYYVVKNPEASVETISAWLKGKGVVYPAHTIIRNFFGSMTRKLSVTSSQ
jgi:hypothetical protein